MSDRAKARSFLRRFLKDAVGVKCGQSSNKFETVLCSVVCEALQDARGKEDRRLLASEVVPTWMKSAAYLEWLTFDLKRVYLAVDDGGSRPEKPPRDSGPAVDEVAVKRKRKRSSSSRGLEMYEHENRERLGRDATSLMKDTKKYKAWCKKEVVRMLARRGWRKLSEAQKHILCESGADPRFERQRKSDGKFERQLVCREGLDAGAGADVLGECNAPSMRY